MAQFATIFIPFALQAASTAWQQYQQYEVYEAEQRQRAAVNQASAEAAHAESQATARHTAASAESANRAAWAAHDRQAGAIARDTDAAIQALNRTFARTELERADALRHAGASQRARFADAGLDTGFGSARAVLAGLGAREAEQTRRDHADLGAETAARRDAARARISADWDATADETADRTYRSNLDIWKRQVALNSRLRTMGIQQTAAEQRDLLDLTLSNQRAALGLVDAGLDALGRGLS
ncbi:hypothetical protein [Rhodospira trueperi]|uniref:Uncharacterized protein n=1 Tax=Rhodospira trueperi TaxID=69960 RepID=A0A1G6YIK4_9PROT|nr:hypothetical protein [Rhodospira trueperi]SDD89465.1 hypothetical protein SAMN05421720_1023 [Rhodospira trueperi]